MIIPSKIKANFSMFSLKVNFENFKLMNFKFDTIKKEKKRIRAKITYSSK